MKGGSELHKYILTEIQFFLFKIEEIVYFF